MSKIPSFAEYVGLAAAGFEAQDRMSHHTSRVQSAASSHVVVAMHRPESHGQRGR